MPEVTDLSQLETLIAYHVFGWIPVCVCVRVCVHEKDELRLFVPL